MSEKLRRQLRISLVSRQLKALLSNIESLKFVGIADDVDNLIPPDSIYKDMIRLETTPTSQINICASEVELSKWLRDCLEKARIKEKCYLIIADMGELPWARVQISFDDWLPALWNRLENHSLLLLSHDQTTVLGLFEEEYQYQAYIEVGISQVARL